MRIHLPLLFENLKQQVLNKAGIKIISPGDCRFLSATISNHTGKQISDTTLKRIFGFTFSKFSPSLYTLNILAEYCGHDGWDAFSKQTHLGNPIQKEKEIKNQTTYALTKAINISHRTLQALTNRSVIPFNLTVKRNLLSDHLKLFGQSSETATVITAPAGYGKTTSICHWVEEQLSINSDDNNKALVFLSSKVLSPHPRTDSLSGWLHALMGIESDLAEFLETEPFRGKQLYLIIDGFDKENFRSGEFELLADNLLDLIALYRNSPNFKVILSLRSASWVSLRNRILIENTLSNWFLGFMQNEAQETNMQLLNAEEIRTFCHNINPGKSEVINPQVTSLFTYPLFLQYYYQKHAHRLNLSNLDYFGIYDVISSYFADKIYNTHLATEKVIIITTLLQHGKVVNDNFIVDKLKVYERFTALSDAYNELLSIGFLREINRSTDEGFAKHIEFAHERLLAYAMARNLVYNNNGLYDEHLITALSTQIADAHKVPVLKWCIFNAIKARQFHFFKCIVQLYLHPSEKANLLKFLINLIQHKYLSISEADPFKPRFCQEYSEVFYYFFGLEFISPEYEEVLQRLLTLDLEEASRILIHTCLGILGIVQLNTVLIENSIAELGKVTDNVLNTFQINPLICIDAIYQYLKFGAVKKEALAHITHFYFNPPEKASSGESYSANHIIYLLAISAMGIANNKRKLIRFINVLEKDTTANDQNTACKFFLNITKADSYFTLGAVEEGKKVFQEIVDDFVNRERAYTPYMKVCMNLASAKMMAVTGCESEAHLVVEKTMQVSSIMNFKYIEAYILAAYLEMPGLNVSSVEYKEANYRFIKLIRSAELNPDSFLAKKHAHLQL